MNKAEAKPTVKNDSNNIATVAESISAASKAYNDSVEKARQALQATIDRAKSSVNIEAIAKEIVRLEKKRAVLLDSVVKLDNTIKTLRTVVTGSVATAKKARANGSRSDQPSQAKKWSKGEVENGLFSVTLLSLDTTEVNSTLSMPTGLSRDEFNMKFDAVFPEVKDRPDSDKYRFWQIYQK